MAAMILRVIPWLPAAIRYKSSNIIIIMETIIYVIASTLKVAGELCAAVLAAASFWVIMTIFIG